MTISSRTSKPPRSSTLDRASLFGILVVLGSIVWWVYTDTPSLQVDADAAVVGVIGLVLVALSLPKGLNRWVALLAFWLAAVAVGLSIAHASPLSWEQWEADQVLAGSIMIVGSAGYLAVLGTRLAAKFHWLSYVLIVMLVAFFSFAVFFLSRDIAIA